MATITRNVTLNPLECCNCGVVFAITETFESRRRKSGDIFYCPNGHGQSYTPGPTEADKLREQLKQEARSREVMETRLAAAKQTVETLRRSRAAMSGEITKIKKRVANSVCPCCNRSFPNDKLHLHLATKHPDFTKGAPNATD